MYKDGQPVPDFYFDTLRPEKRLEKVLIPDNWAPQDAVDVTECVHQAKLEQLTGTNAAGTKAVSKKAPKAVGKKRYQNSGSGDDDSDEDHNPPGASGRIFVVCR